jgi:hypothetical protein
VNFEECSDESDGLCGNMKIKKGKFKFFLSAWSTLGSNPDALD